DLISEHDRWNSGLGEPSLREKLLSRGPVQLLGLMTKRAINFSLRESDALMVTSSKLGESLSNQFDERDSRNSKPIAVVRNVFPEEMERNIPKGGKSSLKELNVLYAGTLG